MKIKVFKHINWSFKTLNSTPRIYMQNKIDVNDELCNDPFKLAKIVFNKFNCLVNIIILVNATIKSIIIQTFNNLSVNKLDG